MRTRLTRCLAASALLFTVSIAAAQSQRTEHTLKLDDPDSRPAATLEDVAWLTGSWAGEAFGGAFEQVWNPASAGSMVGLFKLMNGDEVNFYEILLLVEEEGSLSLKVKHFSPEFTAWEDKADYTRFRFIKADENAIYFSGISYHRIGSDEIHAYLAMRSGDSIREEKLVYRRR
jgi:hypothetical protein